MSALLAVGIVFGIVIIAILFLFFHEQVYIGLGAIFIGAVVLLVAAGLVGSIALIVTGIAQNDVFKAVVGAILFIGLGLAVAFYAIVHGAIS